MPKMKSKKALMNRVRVTGSGKLKRSSSHISHLSHNKSQKQKRHVSDVFKGLSFHFVLFKCTFGQN